jgi:hypothetical protein
MLNLMAISPKLTEHSLGRLPQDNQVVPALDNALAQAEDKVQKVMRLQFDEMFKYIDLLGKSACALQEEQFRLKSENTCLKEQEIQLTLQLKTQCSCQAEHLYSKIDAFCQKFMLFQNDFKACCEPALQHLANIKNYETHNQKDGSHYWSLCEKECENNFFTFGEWEERKKMSCFYTSCIGKYFDSIENLGLSFKKTIKICIEKEIEKIQTEIKNEEQPIVFYEAEKQTAAEPIAITNQFEASFQAAVERNKIECRILRQENQSIIRENYNLVQRASKWKKVDNKKISAVFLAHIYSYLPLNEFITSNKEAIDLYMRITYNYQKSYSEMSEATKASYKFAGNYREGLKLKEELTAHSNKLIEMISDLGTVKNI